MTKTAGILYIVATPIGNLADMSERAIKTLQDVDVIAAEDTRHSQHLLQHHAIQTKCLALHEHNELQQSAQLVSRLKNGESMALISDAGTPLVSDPGYRLVRAAQDAEVQVVPIPGACAAVTALSAAGLPSDRFCFEGFLPSKSTARITKLEALSKEPRTLIFYESPHRIIDCLQDMRTVFGEARELVVARELTKKFETIYRNTVENVIAFVKGDSDQQKGEFVLLLQGEAEKNQTTDVESERVLTILLKDLPLKQAVKLAVQIMGKNKNALYDLALTLPKPNKSQ